MGYRRATTSQIARRCEVQENVLYRVWPSKEDMFAAVIDYIYRRTIQKWQQVFEQNPHLDKTTAILEYERVHHGENRLYQIVFAGLTETQSPVIRQALQAMYQNFQKYLAHLIKTHQDQNESQDKLNASITAWAMIGIGMVEQIRRELDLAGSKNHGKIIYQVGQFLLSGDVNRSTNKRGKGLCVSP
jgi:AcrR family transcriptional regulator